MEYFTGGLRSLGHTPIYKTHKYFARRPHNVFRALIEHYVPPGGVVLDCFGGGGVTVVEALTARRRAISYDLNPIATLIQLGETAEISEDRFRHLAGAVQERVAEAFRSAFSTACRRCNAIAHVRWFEHAYLVNCSTCEKQTSLNHVSKKKSASGRAIDGSYECKSCGSEIKSSSAPRLKSEILNLRLRCGSCDAHETVAPSADDLRKYDDIFENEAAIADRYRLHIPEDEIPAWWDRQKEDLLHRKGFLKFKDLFTPRNRLVSAYYFKALDDLKNECSLDEWTFLLMNVSALLRYTNNMTFSVNSWMDGRPVAWAKHAYWTPNQFIECNPMEYFNNRIRASCSAIRDRRSRFTSAIKGTPAEVVSGKADYAIVNGTSAQMSLEAASVDAIITDPPYGSNVQYGELCSFWYIWVKERLPFESDFRLEQEAVVHRKKGDAFYNKTFQDYRDELTKCFAEGHRVLKEGGVLAFTFNNRNISAWYAVIRAALDAGFDLDPDGITYQEPINAYRDTAHLRFEGTAQGDFIYSFVKRPPLVGIRSGDLNIDEIVDGVLRRLTPGGTEASAEQLVVAAYTAAIAQSVADIRHGATEEDVASSLDIAKIRGIVLDRIVEKEAIGHDAQHLLDV